MLDVLRGIIDESNLYYADDLPEALDDNQISWQREHEYFLGDNYALIIEINDEYFQFSEDVDNLEFLDVIQVKPHIVTKTEYIEVT